MFLVGDRILIPSPNGGQVAGTVELIDQKPFETTVNYVINTDDCEIVIRSSEDDNEVTFLNNAELDFS